DTQYFLKRAVYLSQQISSDICLSSREKSEHKQITSGIHCQFYTHTHTHTHDHKDLYVHTHIRSNMVTHTHTRDTLDHADCTHTHSRTHARTHAHTHTHTQTHTHTNTGQG